jgi:flagellar biosynthesis protein FlhG
LNKTGDKFNKYFELLEINPGASLQEIRQAYRHLRELYSTESIATMPVRGEISEARRREILDQIEEAYQGLMASYKEGHIAPEFDQKEILSGITVFTGQTLRQIRERLNIDLYDVALSTNVQIRNLEDIETENFDALPPDVYTRGFVISYARYLSLDTNKVVDDYMHRYYEWKAGRKSDT